MRIRTEYEVGGIWCKTMVGAEQARAGTTPWVALLAAGFLTACGDPGGDAAAPPAFERVQPELFATPGAQPNAWADFDRDGDLDLFVGMRYSENRLYRNDAGTFVDVAPQLGLADLEDTRAAAWGDYDGDGDLDLYVGHSATAETPNRLYRNDDQVFVDVTGGLRMDLLGNTRQPSWIDYDGDGDLDLFVAMRDQPNRLFRNDGPADQSTAAGAAWIFTDVTLESGLGDPRRTVGVVWFDYDRDGDLDIHVSNQNGDEDAFYRNEGDGTFVDVAPALGMNHPNRGEEYGSVAPAVTDYDNDGDLDLFIATYGPDILWRNNGDGTFTDVTDPATLGVDYHSTTAAWADVDHNGLADLVVTSYLSGIAAVEDHLFMNEGDERFTNALPANLLEHGPSHGVAWADFDRDGDLDLAIANNDQAGGTHHLYRNLLSPEAAARSLQVAATDADGRTMVPGTEIQLLDHDTGRILGTRLIDTGGGYCSQGATPAHFGIPAGLERVDVRVTYVNGGRRTTVVREGVFPPDYRGGWLIVRQEERAVWTDGDFDDWEGVGAVVVDPTGDVPAGSPVDLGAIAAQDDPRFLHFLIDLGDTVTVQGMRGSVELVLDTDGDAGTGDRYGDMDGADLVIVLTRQPDPARDGYGAGVGVRRIGSSGPGDVERSSRVGLLVSPTHSSDRFEVRLERAALAKATGRRGVAGPGDAVAGRLRYLRGGAVVDETAVFRHTLATPPGEDPPLLGADAVARPPGALRVVAWNVSSMSFRNNQDAFRRVVAALAPDVLLLDEIHLTVTPDDLARFTRDLAAEGEGWAWWLASGGGRQRTAVGASGREVRGENGMRRIGYPPGVLEDWLAEVGDEPEVPGMAPPSALARVEAEGGLSATGAWVTVDGHEVLFVPVDLQSAGYDGSPRDRLRELQARTLNQAIAAALDDRRGAGLVVAGDLNVVGSARPLDELRRGLGVGGHDLEVARLERLRDRSLTTWRSTWGEEPFSPGRLDYLLYRGAVLRVERAFLFDAADLSAHARESLGILASDTEKSDHLPLVVDFGGRPGRPGTSASIPGAV